MQDYIYVLLAHESMLMMTTIAQVCIHDNSEESLPQTCDPYLNVQNSID
jgi:hypothetical protein